jgi:hypothetical protein
MTHDTVTMNFNYLLRDEVQYELCVRGVNSDADVLALRKLLPSVIAQNIPVGLHHLRDVGSEQLYSFVYEKVGELQAQNTQPGSSAQAFVIRMKTRVSHLRERWPILYRWGLCPNPIPCLMFLCYTPL